MKDQHRHCPCNGVLLCGTCHREVHRFPVEARDSGFIVSRHVAEPGTVRVEAYFGDLILDCDGQFDYHVRGVYG